jgi:hypothetical protein
MIEATRTGFWMGALLVSAYLGVLAVVFLPAILPGVFG